MSAVKHKEGAGRLDSGLRSNNTIFSFELSISRCRCGGSSDLVKVPQLYLDLGVIVMLQLQHGLSQPLLRQRLASTDHMVGRSPNSQSFIVCMKA